MIFLQIEVFLEHRTLVHQEFRELGQACRGVFDRHLLHVSLQLVGSKGGKPLFVQYDEYDRIPKRSQRDRPRPDSHCL